MAAANSGDLATVDALLAAGASTLAVDFQGLNAMDFAVNNLYATTQGGQRGRAPPPRDPGQEKGAKFPTSKAPLSAVFHSFRLIFGRAIVSRSALEAWVLFPKRARAAHSR